MVPSHGHAEGGRHAPRGHQATHGRKSPAKEDPYAKLPSYMRPTENSIHALEANPHVKDDQAFYQVHEKRVSEIMQALRCGLLDSCRALSIDKMEQAIDAGDFDPQTGKQEVCSMKTHPHGGATLLDPHRARSWFRIARDWHLRAVMKKIRPAAVVFVTSGAVGSVADRRSC